MIFFPEPSVRPQYSVLIARPSPYWLRLCYQPLQTGVSFLVARLRLFFRGTSDKFFPTMKGQTLILPTVCKTCIPDIQKCTKISRAGLQPVEVWNNPE